MTDINKKIISEEISATTTILKNLRSLEEHIGYIIKGILDDDGSEEARMHKINCMVNGKVLLDCFTDNLAKTTKNMTQTLRKMGLTDLQAKP